MENDIWFKKKKYGYGWVPANGKGWLVLFIFALCMCVYPLYVELTNEEFSPHLYLVICGALVITTILICQKKGEKLGWPWDKQ